MVLGLIYLAFYPTLGELLFQQELHRAFYLSTLPASLAIAFGLYCCGNLLLAFLVKKQWLSRTWSGLNFSMAVLLGAALMGNLAILGGLLNINQPWPYQLLFAALVLLGLYLPPKGDLPRLTLRVRRAVLASTWPRWLWGLPLLLILFRWMVTFLPYNGTEQLHNTLPFAKMLFNGVNFNQYTLDNHFLLLGTYETFGVFIRAFTQQDFAYHIVAQQTTFLVTILSMTIALVTIPQVIRRLPELGLWLACWPVCIDFAPTDSIAFKPDWLAVQAAGVASLMLWRQWQHRFVMREPAVLFTLVVFCALAISFKLTALPYVMFLLVPAVLLSVARRRKVLGFHLFSPLLFFGAAGVFLLKNIYWLGNPVFPGFQNIFPKPERLAGTTTFNTFQINKVTRNIPDAFDYLMGYLRFWDHHPEFIVPVVLVPLLYFLSRQGKTGSFQFQSWFKPFFYIVFLFIAYLTLMNFYFYPSIYQRYVAFSYLFMLLGLVVALLPLQKVASKAIKTGALVCLGVLIVSHAKFEANVKNSLDWWWNGISPQAYRFKTDDVEILYDKINRHCPDPGPVLNQKWRNYLYLNHNAVNLEDLQGWLYEPEFYDQYGVNLVIYPKQGPKADEFRHFVGQNTWFLKEFSVIAETKIVGKDGLYLWQRNQNPVCQPSINQESL